MNGDLKILIRGITTGLTLLIVLCVEVRADSLLLGGVSHHFFSKRITNSNHRAIILEKENYLVGYLRNSHDQDTFLVGYKVWSSRYKFLTTNVYMGAIKGYDKCFRGFHEYEHGKTKVFACPLLVLGATINTETAVEPEISLWGDAIVLSGRYYF